MELKFAYTVNRMAQWTVTPLATAVALAPVKLELSANVIELSDGHYTILWRGKDPTDLDLSAAEEIGAEEAAIDAYHDAIRERIGSEQIGDERDGLTDSSYFTE